jgi:hypothetical protein
MHMPFVSGLDELLTTISTCCPNAAKLNDGSWTLQLTSVDATQPHATAAGKSASHTCSTAALQAVKSAVRESHSQQGAAAATATGVTLSKQPVELLRALLFQVWPAIEQLPLGASAKLICQEGNTPAPTPGSTAACTKHSKCDLLDTWVQLVCAVAEQGKFKTLVIELGAGCACLRIFPAQAAC